ncbi:MAG: glycoside hydrolase family 97 N-terminal domain-containing protein, partial [Prevotellaceae bacterium]|nr:glycoside hydrolase family 97 N-terminal domain-containing protein [Prevotellaceae bacterium]
MNKKLKTFGLIWCIIAIFAGCRGTDQFTVCSPDGQLALRVTLDEQGCLLYSIARNDSLLFQASPMGVFGADSANTFVENLTFVKVSDAVIDETYSLPTGKTRIYHNRCNEKCFHFRNAAGNVLQFICRAYDDGVAFRYVMERDGNIGIVSEKTRFNLPGDAVTWMMNYKLDYENYYLRRKLADIEEERLSYPALIQTGEHWLLLTEANVYNHPATHLRKTADGTLAVVFPEDSFTVAGRYESPWRTFIIGDKLSTIVESTLVENLNPPSVIPDASWIEPGVAVFPWWGNFMANTYMDTLKSYVDLAAEMNWQWI